MENRTTIERDDVFIKKDGSMLSVALSASPLRSAQGETVGAVVAFRDSTERRRLEDQLSTRRSSRRWGASPAASPTTSTTS